MALFDATSYLGRWPGELPGYTTVQDLLAQMDRLGIERALICHALALLSATEIGNAKLCAEIAGEPRLEPCWVAVPGPAMDALGGVEAFCRQLDAHQVRAVRLFPRTHVYPLVDWMAGDLLAALEERRCLVQIDLDQVFSQLGLYEYDPEGFKRVAWICETYPRLSLLLTRLGYRPYQVLLPLLKKFPNLYLDLSFFATHMGVEDVVRQVGAGRLLFGTSQPRVDPAGAVACLAYADLTAEQRRLIASGNLEQLLEAGAYREKGAPRDAAIRAEVVATGRQALEISDLSEPQPDHSPAGLALAGRSLALARLDVLDAHAHLGPYFKFHIPNPDAAHMVQMMDRCGVSRTCLSSHMAVSADWKTGNRVTKEAVDAFPERLIGFVVVDPNAPGEILEELETAFDRWGFRGIKLVPDTHLHPIGGAGYRPVWDFAAERNCPVIVHTYHGSKFDDPTAFGPLAERHPEVNIMLVHSGALTAAFENAIALARRYPNLYLDISGSFITGPWIARMVRETGADRVIFSSDIPFIDLRYTLGKVVFALQDPGELALVLGGNFRRLLHIDNPSSSQPTGLNL